MLTPIDACPGSDQDRSSLQLGETNSRIGAVILSGHWEVLEYGVREALLARDIFDCMR